LSSCSLYFFLSENLCHHTVCSHVHGEVCVHNGVCVHTCAHECQVGQFSWNLVLSFTFSSLIRNSDDSSIMIKGLDTIADIPKDSGLQEVYAKVASRVNSVLPFVKMAYPDMMGGNGSGALEPLYLKDRRVCRWVILIVLLFWFYCC
jgi:hypothetical protein